jgi:tRNA-dihydrouridine synthase B
MNFWQTIDKPIIGLSPMDGITDASFRFITAKHGRPDVMFTEFVNVASGFYSPHTLIRDLTYCEFERPVVAQIYGNSPEMFYQIAHVVCELGFDGLDINMGCPAKKVAATGCGAALILNPESARSIIRAAYRGIQDWVDGQTLARLKLHPELIEKVRIANRFRTGMESPALRRCIPVSVKTRLGYDRVVVEDWIQILLEEKPAVISLHGRTLKQMYQGTADWQAIGRAVEIAKNSETLIFGNGDLHSMRDVHRRVSESGVNGVLLGRAAQGNPWLFRSKEQLKQSMDFHHWPSPDKPQVNLEERFRVILEHCRHFEQLTGGANFVAMRKHLVRYCADFPGAAELRGRMVRMNSAGEVADCLRNFVAMSASRFPSPQYGASSIGQIAQVSDLQS